MEGERGGERGRGETHIDPRRLMEPPLGFNEACNLSSSVAGAIHEPLVINACCRVNVCDARTVRFSVHCS